MDGTLRQVAPGIWEGTLNGWTVRVSGSGTLWHAVIGHEARRYTRSVIQAESFRDAADKARRWIESNGPAGEL